MKRLMLAAGLGMALIAGRAAAQYGPGGGGMQTGVVDTPQSDDDNVGVDDGSGIIQGKTDLDHKVKKKKKKDPDCHWVNEKGYRTKNCW